MKKLYALLVILIIIYIGINVGANGLNILSSNDNATVEANDTIAVGASGFPALENFTDTKINDTAVKLVDNNKNVNILVEQLDDSLNVVDVYNNLLSSGSKYTSSQVIDQNGVSVYFLYDTGDESYDTAVYFNKNNHNYKITGYNTTYENSDYFINHCKDIIDTIDTSSSSDGKISRF